jgi:hypothetical protein
VSLAPTAIALLLLKFGTETGGIDLAQLEASA